MVFHNYVTLACIYNVIAQKGQLLSPRIDNLIQNNQAVKKACGPQNGYGEKRCEIQGGGQEMAVMVG